MKRTSFALLTFLLISLLLGLRGELSAHDALLIPDGLRDASWWWPQITREYEALTMAFDPAGSLPVYNDYTGLYFNTRGGHRIVSYAPDITRRIWIFGNSAVLGIELPDRYTMPSVLQMLVGNRYRVENMALAAAGIAEMRIYLEISAVQTGDMVIFVDGGLPDEIGRFVGEVQLARRWTKSRGATFYHILQPYARETHPELGAFYQDVQQRDPETINWGDLFADRERVFFRQSGLHVNDEGSIVLAYRIYTEMKDK